EIGGQRLEDMFARLLAGGEVAALAKPQHHVEETQIRPSVGDRIMLAPDRADPNAAERENAGFYRGPADDFDGRSHIETAIEIGGIFDGEMRHGGITPAIRLADQAK